MLRKLHKVTALVFLVLWVPISAHCYLEEVPGLEFLKCASDTAERSNCDGDGCCLVESGFYKISDASGCVAVAPVLAVNVLVPRVDEAPVAGRGSAVFESVSPELLQSWQFNLRTALPARAPSLAS